MEKEKAEIMHFFRYTYRNNWAPDHIFNGKSRAWIQAFNQLIKEGLIERRKKHPGYEYKWKASFPENF